MDEKSSSFVDLLLNIQKTIPFVMSSVALGINIVNHTPLRGFTYIIITFVCFAVVFISNLKLITITSFIYSSIGYLSACAVNVEDDIDISIKVLLPIVFSILAFIDIGAIKYSLSGFDFGMYVGGALFGLAWGFAFFYLIGLFPKKNLFLYDFESCSCDTCANMNKCANNGVRVAKIIQQ